MRKTGFELSTYYSKLPQDITFCVRCLIRKKIWEKHIVPKYIVKYSINLT